MNKPRIFIGSSVEGIEVAKAIQINLDRVSEITIWNQGFFELSSITITTLVKSLSNFDYAIFVFSSDDITKIRGKEFSSVRDNVIFETGLFIGKLGLENVYFLKPRGHETLHLPTDLLGVTPGEYEANRNDGNLIAATGPFCTQVQQKISSFKVKDNNNSKSIKEIKTGNDSIDNLDNEIKMIAIYAVENDLTTISFKTIMKNIHPKFNEEYVMSLVEKNPFIIRRCQLKNGDFGIKFLEIDI